MSLKSKWKKLKEQLKDAWSDFVEKYIAAPDPFDLEKAATSVSSGLPSPSLASCWEGSNAQTRHMNTLSHAFTDEQAEARFRWAKDRGCNTVHLFVCNQGDGEGAGYSIYWAEPKLGKPESGAVERMAKRIRKARSIGLKVCLWLMADDSSKWNKTLLADPARYAADLKSSGLLDLASCVVLGLEMDEYMTSSQASALASAIRGVYKGQVGTHHTSGKSAFAGLGDIIFWQVKPGKSASQIESSVLDARKSSGKPVIMFELARNPQRELCEAALKAGAKGVGNW